MDKTISIKKRHYLDLVMTTKEAVRFEQAMVELKEGKTTSLSDLKKELGLNN